VADNAVSNPASVLGDAARFSDVRNRLWFLFFGLIVYRIGTYIPVPGIDPQRVAAFFAGNENSVRCADASSFEGGVLARFADLQVERTAAVDDAAPMPPEPSQHRSRQFGGIAMVAGV